MRSWLFTVGWAELLYRLPCVIRTWTLRSHTSIYIKTPELRCLKTDIFLFHRVIVLLQALVARKDLCYETAVRSKSSYKWFSLIVAGLVYQHIKCPKNSRSIASSSHPNCCLPMYLQVSACGGRGWAIQGVISKSRGIGPSWFWHWAFGSHPLGFTVACREDFFPRWCECCYYLRSMGWSF